MRICKQCKRQFVGKYRKCDRCRAKDREYERRRRKGGNERAEGESKQRATFRKTVCKHKEEYCYGDDVFVCADCGRIRREELVAV